MELKEVEKYMNVVIPNIISELQDATKSDDELRELYTLYEDVLRMVAPYNFSAFNDYLELDEDKNEPNRGFHHHRKSHMEEVWKSLNDMEVYDKYDVLLISLPPRVGKTTYGIRFLAWICGKYPEYTQLATSYSDSITSSFYAGVMEIILSERYQLAFVDSPLINQNAKRQEIWLKVSRRYPTIAFVPVGGSVTGRVEANNYLYVDDLVSGMEEALSITRLEKLWSIFSVNFYQRRKQGCKMVIIATRWSVHDPMSIIENKYEGDIRFKNVKIPAYNDEGESNFEFKGGFNTNYYKDMEKAIDPISFDALYMQKPVEREGLLYYREDLKYYTSLPEEQPDAIISVCDSKNMGIDNVSSPVGYVYGDQVFIEDVVYNDGLPEITRPLVANMWLKHKVNRGDVEMNNGGNYYAEYLDTLVKEGNGKTSIRMFYSGNNKIVKIITFSDYVKKNFIFKDPSTYSPTSEYAEFMRNIFTWTQNGKSKHDDGVDSISMLAQLHQDLSGYSIKILNRKTLGL